MPKKYLTIVQQYAVRQMLAEKVTMNMMAMHLRMSEKFLATEIERLNLNPPPETKKGASRYGQEARSLFARKKGAVCMTASANTACPQNKDKLPDRSSHITQPIRSK